METVDDEVGTSLTTSTALWTDDEFDEMVDEMVTDYAPNLFAVVQVRGSRVDGHIAAWGMAFEHHAEVISTSGDFHMSLQCPERALHAYTKGEEITARLVWVKSEEARQMT